jgi:DNA (cytosine-5)-methyltransferase 1
MSGLVPEVSLCLNAGGMGRTDYETETMLPVAFTCSEQANGFAWERDVYGSLTAQIPNDTSNIQQGVRIGWRVRRLTPTECERLQGFPDGYTNIPYRGKNGAPDGPRYKALGNSMAVNCMRWIGRRIEMVDALTTEQET